MVNIWGAVGVTSGVWVSSNSGCVWVSSVGGSVWVSRSVCSIRVVEYSWVGFRVSFTLGDDMSSNWVVDIWESSVGICGVWGNVLNLGLYVSDFFGKFVLLFSYLYRVSFFWDSLLGHAFGVVGVHVFDNWYSWYGTIDNWYYWLDNMSSIGVVNTIDSWYTGDVAVNELGVSFWLSKSDGHKGKQSNKAEHG